MVRSPRRLVERIHGRLHAAEPFGGSVPLAWRDRAELEARVQTLRAMGESFRRVGLSRYVAPTDAMRVSGGVGGECVATEV
jgi:hypothetical protein